MRSDFVVEHTPVGLAVHGDCDLGNARRLDASLRRAETHRRRWVVDLSRVAFADSHGLAPLAESVRRSRWLRLPELRIHLPARPVLRVLDTLEVNYEPFDLRAWDAADRTTTDYLTAPRL